MYMSSLSKFYIVTASSALLSSRAEAAEFGRAANAVRGQGRKGEKILQEDLSFWNRELQNSGSNGGASPNPSKKICLGDCSGSGDDMECIFTASIDFHSSELGYYTFEECGDDTNPTLGLRKGVTYRFIQKDLHNYYHPMGFAYYPDGAHDDVDELEPGIVPPGSDSKCGDDMTCPAPMYITDDTYLGTYSNNERIAPVSTEDEDDFGLDAYEPEFFGSPEEWADKGIFSVALKFDIDDFEDDIFYFCHIHQFMSARIKWVDENGEPINKKNTPELPYDYDTPSKFDRQCGTYDLGEFQLPNKQCPDRFVCDDSGKESDNRLFSDCVEAMNCHMTAGMTTKWSTDSPIALFSHQMIPHHQNAVNMAKTMMKMGGLDCPDITEESDDCVMKKIMLEIINGQNHQIQLMRSVLESKGYPQTDDCQVHIG